MPRRNIVVAHTRGFSSVVVLGLAVLGLAACGGGKGSSGAGPAAQTPGSRVYLQN
jgi:hypothetical protein